MARILLLPCILLGVLVAHAGESSGQEIADQISFPFDLAIIDPDAKEKRPPYVIVFAGGLDKEGNDIRRPLGRLKKLRGASKLFPESNQDRGLPVVLRGLRFHCNRSPDGTVISYEVELQGEFNMVRVPVSKDGMKSFLSGQRTTFVLTGAKNYRVYSYVSSITMDVQFDGKELLIFSIEGDFTFREGAFTYVSKTTKLNLPASRNYLYRGEPSVSPSPSAAPGEM
jgi:hypothetical protein